MTKKELSQLRYLNREIEADKRRLAELEAAATDTAAKITGMPHVPGISNKSAIAAQIADIRIVIEEKLVHCMKEYNRLNRYIAGIDDSLIRQILSYRYVDGYDWDQVAAHIGGGNTAEGIRSIHRRFLRSQAS